MDFFCLKILWVCNRNFIEDDFPVFRHEERFDYNLLDIPINIGKSSLYKKSINLPFSNRILDTLLTYCHTNEIDGSKLKQIKSIWLQLEVDEQCIPLGHPVKIKWFELLVQMDPSKSLKTRSPSLARRGRASPHS